MKYTKEPECYWKICILKEEDTFPLLLTAILLFVLAFVLALS